MSIKVITRSWEQSKQNGTRLLAIIALADYANDDGIGWPSMNTLAKRCRLQTRRAIQKICAELKAQGEIFYDTARGIGRSNLFCVTIGLEYDTAHKSLIENFKLSQKDADKFLARMVTQSKSARTQMTTASKRTRVQTDAGEGVQTDAGGASKRTRGVRPNGRPEPPLNRHLNRKQTTTTSAVAAVDQHRAKYLSDAFGIDAMNAQTLTTLPHVTQSYIDAYIDFKRENPEARGGFYYQRMSKAITPPNMNMSLMSKWKREMRARERGLNESEYVR